MSISIIIHNLGNIINSINYNFLLAIIYLITLIVLIYQYRLQRQPILNTKIKAQGINSKQKGLEYIGGNQLPKISGGDDNFYLFISNDSKNIARNIKIKLKFKINGVKQPITDYYFVSYLNPDEYTRIILIFAKKLLEKYPNKFEKKIKGDTEFKLPKNTIKLTLNLNISYTGYKHKNEYFIEWIGLDSMPNQNKIHMNCWNKRNELYIFQNK